MNEALENDELKKEPPRERGLGLGFGVVSVEILDQRGNSKKPETPKVFLPNTYVLLLRDEDRTLFYLDYEENKKIKIADVPDLNDAIQKSAHDFKAAEIAIQHYHLQQGGGNHFNIFENEKHIAQDIGKILPEHDQKKLSQWIKTEEGNSRLFSILNKETLGKVIPALLLTVSVRSLTKNLPTIINHLSDETLKKIFDDNLFQKLDKRFMTSLLKSRFDSHFLQQTNLIVMTPLADPETPVYSVNLTALAQSLFSIEKIKDSSISPDILACLVPALLNLMDEENKKSVAEEIAKHLPKKYFRALLKRYFHMQPTFSTQERPDKLLNNGRTLLIQHPPAKDKQGNTKATFIEFKEKPWNLENFHIHIETDEKKEREFKVYPTRAVLEKVKKKLQADPNKAIVAEIHLVFSRTGKNGMKKYIAIGFVAKIGKENEAFKALLNTIGQQKLDRERKLDIVLNYFKMFGAYFKAAEASDLTRLHTWASLKRQDGFYDGLVFNVVLNPIEFSEEQIKQLETLFGELVLLEGKYALEPIDRSANFTITIP